MGYIRRYEETVKRFAKNYKTHNWKPVEYENGSVCTFFKKCTRCSAILDISETLYSKSCKEVRMEDALE